MYDHLLDSPRQETVANHLAETERNRADMRRVFEASYKMIVLNHSQMRTNIIFLLVAICTVAAWVFWAYQPFIFGEKVWGVDHPFAGANAPEGALGLWGDSFGALNALLAAGGFLAIILTLIEQQRDQHRQRFDATFFEMLRMLREERDSLRFKHSSLYLNALEGEARSEDFYKGKAAAKAAAQEYSFWLRNAITRLNSIKHDRVALKREMSKLYVSKIHMRQESRLGVYFRVLYTIIEKIDSDKFLSKKEKERYGNILRAQMSAYEVQLAGVNGLSEISKDFPILLQKFRMLKYMRRGKLKDLLIIIYGPKTFEPREVLSAPVEIVPLH